MVKAKMPGDDCITVTCNGNEVKIIQSRNVNNIKGINMNIQNGIRITFDKVNIDCITVNGKNSFKIAETYANGLKPHPKSDDSGKNDGKQIKALQQLPAKIYKLMVSLEDIYKGCIKNVPITRKIVFPNGTVRIERAVIPIKIKPGFLNGSKFIFKNAGDQLPKKIPADIVIVVQDMPHPNFARKGSDILYTQKLTLKESFFGTTFQVPTLDGSIQEVYVNPGIFPFSTKKLAGQGLPHPHKIEKRGDLIIKFNVKLF